MRLGLEIAASVFTIGAVWLMGSKNKWAPLTGIVGQSIWIWYVLYMSSWGLMPMAVFLLIVYIRNQILWRKNNK